MNFRKRSKSIAEATEQFLESIEEQGDCWIWTGGRDNAGYGKIHWPRDPVRDAHREDNWGPCIPRLAHRVSFELFNGYVPAPGLVVRHVCDTPSCVNPDHLLEGTHAENMADMIRRGRAHWQKKGGESGGLGEV